MRLSYTFVTLLLALPVHPFSCDLTTSSVTYDLRPLAGLRISHKQTPTPPTTSEAVVRMDLCTSQGVPLEYDGLPDEDEVGPSDSPPPTSVADLYDAPVSGGDETLREATEPQIDEPRAGEGNCGRPALACRLARGEYLYLALGRERGGRGPHLGRGEGMGWVSLPLLLFERHSWNDSEHQHVNLTLRCDPSASEAAPTFVYYSHGRLSMVWSSPDACPRSASSGGSDTGSRSSEGLGFWGFFRFLFYAAIIGLLAYFVLGMTSVAVGLDDSSPLAGIFYNHQQYSAKGWDLVPHRDFWREFPTLISDLFGHIFNGVRGAGGGPSRGGYSSLG